MVDNDILIAFSIFQITFFILDVFILLKADLNVARKGECVWFRMLIMTHMGYLVLNTIWSLNEYDYLHIPRTVLTVICTGSLWAVTNCATSFFLFVVERMQITQLQAGIGLWLRQLPAFLSSAMIISSPWTGLVFHIDENGYFIHGPLYVLTLVISSLYLLCIAVISAAKMMKARTTFLRKANGSLLYSVLAIILFVLVDGTLKKVSILPAAIFAVITGLFITMQEAGINSDSLTGMNNRRKAEDYLNDRIRDVSEKAVLYLYMGDLNGFKKINDTYGHLVGDEALMLTSRALQLTVAKYNGFAARYGGDEFLLVCQPEKEEDFDPERLIADVNGNLEALSKGKPYRLVMTLGYVRCTNPKESLHNYLREADSMLYQRKAAYGVGR